MNTPLYYDYSDTCERIKVLERIKEDLSSKILEDMGDATTLKTDYGTFSAVERKKIVYSEQEKEAEVELKVSLVKLQQEDILQGRAKVEITRGIMMRPLVTK